jgi:hypothetical protein
VAINDNGTSDPLFLLPGRFGSYPPFLDE